MRRWRFGALIAALWFAVAPAIAATETIVVEPAEKTAELSLDQREKALGGALKTPALWAAYKAKFITDAGRVIDFANGAISHSEGQGYGMLFAVAANDRIAFDRLWTWTRANLMVRNDALIAWRWDPYARPAIADMNDAADGDILIAWALSEAAEYWGDVSYRVAARRIAVEVGRKLTRPGGATGPLLLPAVWGFAKESRADGPVVNLSAWVFPALARLHVVAPEIDWSGLIQSGLTLLRSARFGPAGLPSDWIAFAGAKPAPAAGFAHAFSYNALRAPLYMALAGVGEREDYAPFARLWTQTQTVAEIDVDSGARGAELSERGYLAVADLTRCVTLKTRLPADFALWSENQSYYAASLQILTVIAARQRYASCWN